MATPSAPPQIPSAVPVSGPVSGPRLSRFLQIEPAAETRRKAQDPLWKSIDPFLFRLVVNGGLLTLAGVVAGETIASVDVFRKDRALTQLELKMMSNGVTAISILFWPVLWDSTIGYDRLIERPRVIAGFVWPLLISTIDLKFSIGKSFNQESLTRNLASDAQAIISAAFAMGALMAGLKSTRGTHIIMYALIMSLALVIPQVAVPKHSSTRAIVFATQKTALNYAIGYIVAGIGIDFLSGGGSKTKFQRMNA